MGNSCFKHCKKEIEQEITSPLNLTYPPPLINWYSKIPTYNYYGYTTLEKENDYENKDYFNLCSKGGGIEKYDILFETEALEYQKRHHMINNNSNRFEKEYAGFTRLAAMLSCSYPYPENSVVVTHKRKSYLFTQKDIESLMIIATQNAVNKGLTIFFGNYRQYPSNNKNGKENGNEPYPSYLISMLEIITKLEEPFIMDIERDGIIWSYSFDRIFVTKHKVCPIEHIYPTDQGLTTYYNFKIESTANPENNLDLWGYINSMLVPIAGGFHKRMKEGWITKIKPHFIWKTHPKKCLWEGSCELNPHIDAEIVFRIYKHSFTENNRNNNRLIIF